MAEIKKLSYIYKNILGDTKATIDAIQKFIEKNPQEKTSEETPAASINRIIDSVADEEIAEDIQKIIKNL